MNLHPNPPNEDVVKIVQTAETLFRKYGVRSVSMADIARELGMSKKTLYAHIENKDDLIEQVAMAHFHQETQALEEIVSTATDALDEMLRTSLHVQHILQNLNPALLYDLQKYHRPIWERFESFQRDHVYLNIVSNLQRGIAEGLYRADIKPDILGRIYVSCIPIFSNIELLGVGHVTHMQIHEQFLSYHLYGIVSEKGRQLLEQRRQAAQP